MSICIVCECHTLSQGSRLEYLHQARRLMNEIIEKRVQPILICFLMTILSTFRVEEVSEDKTQLLKYVVTPRINRYVIVFQSISFLTFLRGAKYVITNSSFVSQ